MFKLKKLPKDYWGTFAFDPSHFVCEGSLFSNHDNPLLPHESFLYLVELYQEGGIVPLANCVWNNIPEKKISHACHALRFLPCAYAFYMSLVQNNLFAKNFVDAGFSKWIYSKSKDFVSNRLSFLRLMLDCAEKIKRLELKFCPYTALHLRQEFSFYLYFVENNYIILTDAVKELQEKPFSDAMKLPYLDDAIRWLTSLNVDDMIANTQANAEYQPPAHPKTDNAQTGEPTLIKL